MRRAGEGSRNPISRLETSGPAVGRHPQHGRYKASAKRYVLLARVATKGCDTQLERRTSASPWPYLYRGLAQRTGSELNAQCLAAHVLSRHALVTDASRPVQTRSHFTEGPDAVLDSDTTSERLMGLGPTTSALATPRSTTELQPQRRISRGATLASMGGTIAHLRRRRKREDSDLQRPIGRTGLADRRGASHAHLASITGHVCPATRACRSHLSRCIGRRTPSRDSQGAS